MGHRENSRTCAHQPQKEAVETNEDKGVENTEETGKPGEETQPTEEAEAKEVENIVEEEEKPEEIAEKTEEIPSEEAEAEEVSEEKEAVEEAEEIIEEEKPEIEKREEIEEEEIVEERIYTIPLRRVWISPRKKRAPRAVRLVRAFVQRHMKPEALVISNEVNERLWSRGIQKPPRKIRVKAVKDKEGTVTLYLAEGD